MEKRNIAFSPPDITEAEIENVAEVLRSGWITTGPKTKLLEEKIAHYCNTQKAVCLNSATACLETALRLLGIGPGDEVVTSAYTYTASASVIAHVGAKIVLADVAQDSYEMDYERLESIITEHTKAIIPVDLGGVPCDYEKIFDIVERKKNIFHPGNEIQRKLGRIAVVADGAHAFGAEWRGEKVGSIADFTSFSFHAVKNLTTGEGGALTWRMHEGISDEDLYKQCMLLSLHGQSKDALAKTQAGAWEYDVVAPYYKYNMTDIMAAIGLAQLERYPGLLKRRKQIIESYDRKMRDLPVSVLSHYGREHVSSGHLYLVRVNKKTREQVNQIIVEMAHRGVATNVHYKPLPLLSAYRNMGFDIKDYPNAYAMFENEITLPLHTKLTDEDVSYIIEQFEQCVRLV